jgi:hypothetical protein
MRPWTRSSRTRPCTGCGLLRRWRRASHAPWYPAGGWWRRWPAAATLGRSLARSTVPWRSSPPASRRRGRGTSPALRSTPPCWKARGSNPALCSCSIDQRPWKVGRTPWPTGCACSRVRGSRSCRVMKAADLSSAWSSSAGRRSSATESGWPTTGGCASRRCEGRIPRSAPGRPSGEMGEHRPVRRALKSAREEQAGSAASLNEGPPACAARAAQTPTRTLGAGRRCRYRRSPHVPGQATWLGRNH